MDRQELVEELCARCEIEGDICEKFLTAFEDVLAETAVNRENLWLRRELGGFYVQEIGNPYGENTPRSIPKTKYQLRFNVSRELKKLLVQSDEEYYEMLEQLGRHKQAELLRQGNEQAKLT